MPIISKTYHKAFKWREVEGVPAAETVVLAGRAWILCCPLCGCMHEVRSGQVDGQYRPDCLLRRLARMAPARGAGGGADWPALLAQWERAYPGAAAQDTVALLSPASVEALRANQQPARRAARKAAA